MTSNGTTKYDGPFPVVDLESICLRENPSEDDFLRVGKEIVKAFQDYGYIYFTNFGFSKDKFINVCHKFDDFFDMDFEEKVKFRRNLVTGVGYSSEEFEEVEHTHKHMAKRDSYNFWDNGAPFPDVPGLRQELVDLLPLFRPFGKKIMKAIGQGLDVPDNLFEKYHDVFGPNNRTIFRIMRYKSILEEMEDQIRMMEHTDVSFSLTVEIYSDMEGFQVKDKEGKWKDVGMFPDTIIAFPSRDLQEWTDDRIQGTFHRVVVPKDEKRRKLPRHVMIAGIFANEDVIVQSLDGSNKCPPKTVKQRYKEGVKYYAKDFHEYEDQFDF